MLCGIVNLLFLARDLIYTSRTYAMMPVRLSVCLSVTEVHWHIIANSDPTLPCTAVAVLLDMLLAAAVLLVVESSRAMLDFLVLFSAGTVHELMHCVTVSGAVLRGFMGGG